MRFSAIIALGLASFVVANPAPEAEADVAEIGGKRSLAGALPHPIADKIMTAVEPANLVTRQADGTVNGPANPAAVPAAAPAPAKKAKKAKKAKNAANAANPAAKKAKKGKKAKKARKA